jgi:hypothetical protein
VSADELAMFGKVIGRRAFVSREGAVESGLTAEVVRQAAALDERTRLRTLFLVADRSDDLTLGEFVGVEIRGQAAPQALRLPAASLTSRDKVWVVDDGRLRMREVDVVGNEGNFAVVRSFDMANGVVAVPPPSGREGLPVTIQSERQSQLNSGGLAVGAQ